MGIKMSTTDLGKFEAIVQLIEETTNLIELNEYRLQCLELLARVERQHYRIKQGSKTENEKGAL